MTELDNGLARLDAAMAKLKQQDDEKTAAQAVDVALHWSLFAEECQGAAQTFFRHGAFELQPVPKWDIPTAQTDGRHVFYRPDWLIGHTPEQIHGVMCGHEPMHNILQHAIRALVAGMTDQDAAQEAADLEGNQMCRDAGFTLPTSALFPGQGKYRDFPANKTFEEYYTLLEQKKKASAGGTDQQPSNQPGQGDQSFDPGGCGMFAPAKDLATAQEHATRWQRITAAAEQAAARCRGDIPGSLSKLIDRILRPPVNPWDVVRDFVTRCAKTDQSWSRLNRRHLARGIYLPGRHSLTLGDVVFMGDTSGSMDKKQCRLAAGFLQGLLELYPGTLTAIYHDTVVQEVLEWTPADGDLEIEPRGKGGGTSHIDAFEEINRRGLSPAVILCATDLDTVFPIDPGIPTIWLATRKEHREPPFGRVVCIAED